jgi:major membrane immunogen (membrane-anchored lipoprotein)
MKRKKQVILCAALVALLLTACGGAERYQDGVFTGRSGEDDDGAYGEVTVTVQNGEISDCEFVTWQADGSIKDADYGKINGEISNQDFYDKAQLAVRAMSYYAEQLKTEKQLRGVDAVSGATIAYNQFEEAVQNALGAAKK